MKHFIGGYALFGIAVFFWIIERARQDMGHALLAAVAYGWIGGLAAWGLL